MRKTTRARCKKHQRRRRRGCCSRGNYLSIMPHNLAVCASLSGRLPLGQYSPCAESAQLKTIGDVMKPARATMCESLSLSQLCCARVCINTFAYLAAAPSAQQESQGRNIFALALAAHQQPAVKIKPQSWSAAGREWLRCILRRRCCCCDSNAINVHVVRPGANNLLNFASVEKWRLHRKI